MKTDIFTLIASSALVLFSCAKEKSPAPEQDAPMRFAVTVEGTTKASMTSADLKQFYLKVTGPNNAFSYFESIVKDAQGNWTASQPILWKDEESAITYAAASYGALGAEYFNAQVTANLFTAGADMGLLRDQSTQEKLNAADLLTMKETDLSFANSNAGLVPITLSHGLAKVNFNLTLADDFFDNGIGLEANPVKEVVISGVSVGFNFKPLTGEVTVPAYISKGAVTPFPGAYVPGTEADKGAKATFESILAPETIAAGALKLYFTVGGKDYEWSNSEALVLTQGGEFTVPVSVAYSPEVGPGTAVWDGDLSKLTAESTEEFATATDGMTITGTLGVNKKVSIADGATVTLKNATISYSSNGADYAGLTLLGDGTIVLADGTTNTVVGGLDGDGYSNWPGIFVPQGKTLTINGNTGVLNAARGGDDTDFGSPAGIGASWKNPCGNIVINGGVINAVGGAKSAGIGGTFLRTCGDITINGGTITATGNKWGPGIGLGGPMNASSVTSISGCNITITGGTVTATGGWGGAGIGTGYAQHKTSSLTITLGNILISGGTVTATGGEGAAGIGTGGTTGENTNNCGNITITNAVTKVTATKGSGATDSIGKGGANGTCGTVTIDVGASVIQN